MKRIVVLIVLAAVLVGLTVTPAEGHRIRYFDACVGDLDHRCRDRATYLVGDHPTIVAQVRPHHRFLKAELWRRAPHGTWGLLARVAVNDRGRMRWQWDTTASDFRKRPWRFKYRLPGHERTSDIVRVSVFEADN